MNILTFSGFAPEHITDIRRFQGFDGTTRLTNYCGYARDFISQVVEDSAVDGAIIPYSCDSSRVMADYLDKCGKFVYQLKFPVLTSASAVQYFADVIADMREKISGHFNIKISDDNILERCRTIYERNIKLKEIYENIEEYSYYEYLFGINEMLGSPLTDWERHVPVKRGKSFRGKKIYLIGSFITNLGIIKQIEECSMLIAGDNLTNSKRLFSSNKKVCKDNLYYGIASSILSNIPSPTQSDFGTTLDNDISEIKQKEIRGVLYLCQKYCEPYDFMFHAYKSALDSLGIPLHRMYLADSRDRLRPDNLENFYEII